MQEAFIHYQVQANLVGGGCQVVPLTSSQVRLLAVFVGGLPGMLLGTVDGLLEGRADKFWRGLLIGLFAGFLLGYIGLNLGNVVFTVLGGTDDLSVNGNMGAFLHQIIARAFGWSLLGLGIGVGAGLSSFNIARIGRGALGGFLGGFFGGFVFDLVGSSSAPVQNALGQSGCFDSGGPGRLIGFTVIGALCGLLIGIVEEIFKESWVRVLVGRNEGRDIQINKQLSILGRDERCEVPLFGDPIVSPQHAAIRTDGKRHTLLDGGMQGGTMINGKIATPGSPVLLRDGDMIQIGMHRLLFREKATASKVRSAPLDSPRSPGSPPAPVPSHLCPYCGAPKDALGNCLCTPMAGQQGVNQAPMQPLSDGSGMRPDYFAMPANAVGRLIGMEGSGMGQVFSLEMPNITIGREFDQNIVLQGDATISRSHARIVNDSGVWSVIDNNSSNGTFVNGVRISSQQIHPGDTVQFGSSSFRFE